MSEDRRGERPPTARPLPCRSGAVTLLSPTQRYNPAMFWRGGSNGHAGAGSGSIKTRLVAYSRCMRSHGVSGFPDPSSVPGGGYAFEINAGSGDDLNRSNPAFKTASHACRAVAFAGQSGPNAPAPQIAAEVKWARCLRSNGVPLPGPQQQRSDRQQQVRSRLARVRKGERGVQIGGTDGTDNRRTGAGAGAGSGVARRPRATGRKPSVTELARDDCCSPLVARPA
jgi:hypothetical protein